MMYNTKGDKVYSIRINLPILATGPALTKTDVRKYHDELTRPGASMRSLGKADRQRRRRYFLAAHGKRESVHLDDGGFFRVLTYVFWGCVVLVLDLRMMGSARGSGTGREVSIA